MKRITLLSVFVLAMITTACASCSKDSETSEVNNTPNTFTGKKTLVAYFSATGNTQAVAEEIVCLTGADIYRIEAAEPYASNPYDDSDRIQNEAYNNLRPGVANLPEAENSLPIRQTRSTSPKHCPQTSTPTTSLRLVRQTMRA